MVATRWIGPYTARAWAFPAAESGWHSGLAVTRAEGGGGTLVFCDDCLASAFVFAEARAGIAYAIDVAHKTIMRLEGKSYLPFAERAG